MELEHSHIFADGEEESRDVTEIIFEPQEGNSRSRTEKGIARFNMPHVEEVFPERIILLGYFKRSEINKLFLPEPEKPLAQQGATILPQQSIDTVPVSDNYL